MVGSRWALLIRVDVLAPLSSHTPVEEPAGKQLVRKPTQTERQTPREPTDRNSERYETTATPTRSIQSGTYALGYADQSEELREALLIAGSSAGSRAIWPREYRAPHLGRSVAPISACWPDFERPYRAPPTLTQETVAGVLVDF